VDQSKTKQRTSTAVSKSRREFLRTSALAAGVFALGGPPVARAAGPNEKLNIAIIGAGGRGADNTKGVASENIVALCDVALSNLDRAAESFPNAWKVTDFRRLFDRANEFDAVVISTCEHTHAFATLPALKLGKHVYCEKPLTYNVHEARVIREAAARFDRCWQSRHFARTIVERSIYLFPERVP
jgi:hypothetical protein